MPCSNARSLEQQLRGNIIGTLLFGQVIAEPPSPSAAVRTECRGGCLITHGPGRSTHPPRLEAWPFVDRESFLSLASVRCQRKVMDREGGQEAGNQANARPMTEDRVSGT